MANDSFDSLVEELFRRNQFQVTRRLTGSQGPDFELVSSTGVRAIVEVKFYRSRRVATQTLKNVAVLAESLRQNAGADKAVLVTTARFDPLARAELGYIPTLVIYDFNHLVWLLASQPDLAARFDAALREASAFGSAGDDEVPSESRPQGDLLSELNSTQEQGGTAAPKATIAVVPETQGRDLCAKIDELMARRVGASPEEKRVTLAREFEQLCVKALKYLFSDDLTAWNDQLTTDEKVSRFDLIARIHPQSAFWALIVNDFGARYIVFEFKFYGDEIGQGQILTTEKYLYRAALRPVAIIISPYGPDEGADHAARGALRENGKLIINLTVKQLCNMLHARDGTDGAPGKPADVEQELLEVLDRMLMRIER